MYRQPLDVAWGFTLREFYMLTNYEHLIARSTRTTFDADRLADLERHLRKTGAIA